MRDIDILRGASLTPTGVDIYCGGQKKMGKKSGRGVKNAQDI